MPSSTKTTAPIISLTRKPRTRTLISARRVLEQAGIKLKGLNVDKLRAEYQALETQKKELTATYKNCEKEVRDLMRKQENLDRYLGRTQTDPVQEQFKKKNNPIL